MVAWNLQGAQPVKMMHPDERCEVERVLTNALTSLTGSLEGEYLPLPRSTSYCARPGGMTEVEEKLLNADGLLFQTGDSMGRGIFVTMARDMAVWVNAEHHVQIIVKQQGTDAGEVLAKVRSVEGTLRQALQQEGYDYAEPITSVRRLRGLPALNVMSVVERCEVERVLTNAFLELTGDLAGEYFPMPSSTSYPYQLGGMSEEQERALVGDGIMLGTADAMGRGIFITGSGDLIVSVNGEHHLQMISKQKSSPQEAVARFKCLDEALKDVVRQEGYDLD